ncbi:hypothetical protein M8C21_026914 [Ambrosia artemisiifolia]|uniref:Uncharacterized protein n=1 Tax=Ambrosia artemisiifolia TaxID=4212 RepID=A0AAD5GI44_AMBAR|nr:hypothetical protein M8C21_026914 [Ambrosia artemisiifolia]
MDKIRRSFMHMRFFVLESSLLAYYKRKPHDNLVVKTTLKTLEDGGNVEDAIAVCEPNVLHPLIRWKIVNRLHWYVFKFEMAWQHFVESVAVRKASVVFKSLGGLANKIKLVYTILTLPAWNKYVYLRHHPSIEIGTKVGFLIYILRSST